MTKQRTFLITGASKGIGLSAASYLHSLNHQVIGIARQKHTDFPGDLFCADLSDAEQTEFVLNQIQKKYSTLCASDSETKIR